NFGPVLYRLRGFGTLNHHLTGVDVHGHSAGHFNGVLTYTRHAPPTKPCKEVHHQHGFEWQLCRSKFLCWCSKLTFRNLISDWESCRGPHKVCAPECWLFECW